MEKKKTLIQDESFDQDVYSTKLPLLEQFVGRPRV